MHKFLLADNPQAPHTSGLWIIHLPEPVAIIEVVLEKENIQSKKAVYVKDYIYINIEGIIETWQLRLYHCFVTTFGSDAENEKMAIKLLDQAWHWYKAYMKWEDANNNEENI